MGTYTICCLPGDGIGPEITAQAQRALTAVAERFGHSFILREEPIGGAAIDAFGMPLPEATLQGCAASDAVLLGAVGGPQWDTLEPSVRPEKGLLALRKGLSLYANLRPAVIFPELKQASYLRPDIVADGVDVLVGRELTGGIYFGEPRGRTEENGQRRAVNSMVYDESEVRRIGVIAFEAAQKRGKRLCSVDKANVLDVSQLWREVMEELAPAYPDVRLEHMYVDNAAMQLVRDPKQFDVIVTSNLFGDILSDEAATITGSIGMLASASLGDAKPALFEPIHGSAPDIAGQDKANPLAAILSVGMLFRYGLHLEAEADALDAAVSEVLRRGLRTGDIKAPGETAIGCRAMGDAVVECLQTPQG